MANIIMYLFLLSSIRDITAQDGWTLVFKVATGGLKNVLDLYTDNSTLNVDNSAAQSLTSPIAEHFKSDVINNWSTARITQVRLSVYKGGAEVAFFLFNGTGSDRMNWMSKERLLNSSYTDMKNAQSETTINRFSILGSTGVASTQRVFYISSASGSCDVDSGWIVVVDTNSKTYCEWEKMYTSSPSIMYSPLSTKAFYQKELKAQYDILVESLAIHVKCIRCMPNKESTTQVENSPNLSQLQSESLTMSTMNQNGGTTQIESSPNLSNTPTVSSSQLPSQPTTVPRTDQNVSILSKMQTCMEMCSPPIKLSGNMYCYTACSVSATIHTETTHDLNTTPDTKATTSTTQDTTTTISMIDLEEKIRKLNSELKVNKKNTTLYKRSKTSVYEKRTSAVAMGSVGAAVITIIVLLLVIMDCAKCFGLTGKKKT